MPADEMPNEHPTEGPRTNAVVDALASVPRVPGAPKPDPIVVADGVRRHFGGLTAVDVDHVEIQRGSITALIGPNGAGKTTFFNLLTGFDQPQEGKWTYDGKSLSGVPSYKVARLGMVRTFQLTKALSKLSVIDNMRLGATGQRGESFWQSMLPGLWRAQEKRITERADDLLVRFKLDAKRDDFAGTMSGGQRKLLEMARALMVEPGMVMLDEPMAGVNPALRQALLDKISELPGEGITVLFVEHDMDVVSAVSDRVVCMAEGTIIASGTAGQVAADERVIEAYLGGSSGDLRDHERNGAAEPREDVAVHDETADPVTGSPEDGHRDLHSGDDPAGDDAAGGGGAS